MWTTYNAYEDKLEGKGYKVVREITKEERAGKTALELEALERAVKCFVVCNAKATNEYRKRWKLAYMCHINPNSMILGLLDAAGKTIDSDTKNAFSLSCLIQWVFRSRIRDGEPIELYLPSKKLRRIFTEWLMGRTPSNTDSASP